MNEVKISMENSLKDVLEPVNPWLHHHNNVFMILKSKNTIPYAKFPFQEMHLQEQIPLLYRWMWVRANAKISLAWCCLCCYCHLRSAVFAYISYNFYKEFALNISIFLWRQTIAFECTCGRRNNKEKQGDQA